MEKQETLYMVKGYSTMLIRAKSPRLAAREYFRHSYAVKDPKMFIIFVDGKDGKVYKIGYGYRNEWLTIGAVELMREPQ